MDRIFNLLNLAFAGIFALPRAFHAPRPAGWEVGSARDKYEEFGRDRGVSATRYGDWEYSGRCTDF